MINKIDQLIRDNKIAEAQQKLQALALDSIPDRECATVARLARRAGLPKLMMPRLSEMIYETRKASTEDVIEYGYTASRLGLLKESDRLLKDFPTNSRALLYRGFVCIQQWDYAQSIEHFEKALYCSDLTEQNRLLINVNLAAGLIIEGQHQRGQVVIDSTIDQCEKDNHQLYLNCLELSGQVLWYAGEFEKARLHFVELGRRIEAMKGYTSVICKQWEVLSRAKHGELKIDSPECLEVAQAMRNEKLWEPLRHYDWKLSQIFDSENLRQRVYFGTPYPTVKKLVKSQSRTGFGNFRIRPYSAEAMGPVIDPLFESGADLEFGKLEHRLLLTMLSDQYQSWSPYRIYDALYPDERFNPVSGPQKVYRLIGRMAKSAANLGAIVVKKSAHGHRARVQKGSHVRIYGQMQFDSVLEMSAYVIGIRLGRAEFSSQTLCEVLHLHSRTTTRLIAELVANNILEQRFAGRSRFYSLKSVGDSSAG